MRPLRDVYALYWGEDSCIMMAIRMAMTPEFDTPWKSTCAQMMPEW